MSGVRVDGRAKPVKRSAEQCEVRLVTRTRKRPSCTCLIPFDIPIQMLHPLIESGYFLAERNKIERLNSRLLISAVDVMEAGYWLIGGDRYGQALVMLVARRREFVSMGGFSFAHLSISI